MPPKIARSAEAAAGEGRRVADLRREAARKAERHRDAGEGAGSLALTRAEPEQDDS